MYFINGVDSGSSVGGCVLVSGKYWFRRCVPVCMVCVMCVDRADRKEILGLGSFFWGVLCSRAIVHDKCVLIELMGVAGLGIVCFLGCFKFQQCCIRVYVFWDCVLFLDVSSPKSFFIYVCMIRVMCG